MKLLLLLLLTLLIKYSHAQYTFENYTPANGLVDARVSGMVQDKYGRIIIYTREGFSIYDGQRFKNYLTIDNEKIGIITGSILLPDSSLYLVRFTGSPIKVEKNKISYDREFLKDVLEISVVSQVNNNTHLILTNFGAYLVSNKQVKKLTNNNSSIPVELKNANSGAIVNNQLLLYLNDGNSLKSLVLYDLSKEKIVDIIENISLNNIVQDKHGNIYIYNNATIFLIDSQKLAQNKISYSRSLSAIIPETNTGFMLEFDNFNNAWVLTASSDCYKLDRTTNKKTIYNYNTGLLKGVSGLFQDKENNYWFLLHGKGLQKLVQSKYEEVITINGKTHTQKKFIHNLPDGSVFINGTEGQYSVEGDIEKILPAADEVTGSSAIYWQNKYWSFAGINTFQNNESSIIQFNLQPTTTPKVISPKLKTDKEGNVLIAGDIFYLLRKDGESAAVELPYFTDNIATDEESNYWAFCRATSKTIKFSYAKGKLIQLEEFDSPLSEPRCAVYWNKDTFLVGTRNNGLVFVKTSDKKLTIAGSVTREKGLFNNFILDVVKLKNNKIAVATASGVNIISINNDDTTVQNISSAINIYDPIANLAADKEGNLYAVSETTGSLYRYINKQTSYTGYHPQSYISSISVNRNLISAEKNNFSYAENNFSFEIAAPSYTDNRNIKFIFFLNGQSNPQLVNSTGNLELNNLEPGSYDLKIRIIYPGNVYPEQAVFYSFIINKPFWKTWFFIFSLIASFTFFTWLLIRNFYRRKLQRTKIVLEKELAIEQERSRLARELHDGLGSMLSGVKHSFSAMTNQINMNDAQQTIFQGNIDRLNETIKELRTISHSMASENLLKFGLQDSLRDYCQSLNLSGPVKITCSFLHMEGVLLSDEQAFHIFRIIQELLTNMIRHANATEAILQVSFNNNRIYVTVEDNGNGFDMGEIKSKNGLGLKNIESRIKILNGKLDFQTAPSKGTSVLIEIPHKL